MRIVENLKTKTPIAILKEEAESYSKRLEIQLKEFQDDILPNKNLKLKEHIAHIYKLNSDMKQLENELFETKDKLKENETEIAKLQEIFNSQNQLKLCEIGTMTNPVAFKDLKKPKCAIKKGIAIKRKPSMRVSAFSNNLNLYPNFAQPPAMKNRSSVKNPISTSSKKINATPFKSIGDQASTVSKDESDSSSESRSSFDSNSEYSNSKRSKLEPKLKEKFDFEILEEKNDTSSDSSL